MDLRSTKQQRSPSWDQRVVSYGMLAILAIIAGCGTARVHRTRMATAIDRSASFFTARVPGPITAEVLERNGLASPTGLVHPGNAAEKLIASGAAMNDPDGALALADLRSKQARRAEMFAHQDAPGLYLDAIEAVTVALSHGPENAVSLDPSPREIEARKVYNTAVSGFLRCTAGTWMKLDSSWTQKLAALGIEVRVSQGANIWNPERFDHFYFANDFKVAGIHDAKHREGLGVPLIAERRIPPFVMTEKREGEEQFYPQRLQAYPATALLRAERCHDGKRRVLTLDLIDPMRADDVVFARSSRPLSNDLTTPLAFYFTRLPLPSITQVGLLRPGDLEKETGLYLLHPYEPGKIPVVLIHGLWSSPDTWHQALNELRGDPELRERYQFWVYFYPSGDPFLFSATKLRQALNDARATLDPSHTDSAFDRMVLVGHSMGGLLTRLMVIDSETRFWDSIANRPFDELQAGPGQKQLISNVFFFEKNPSIQRVIFIATPHRGSTLSGGFLGRLGNALIRLPGMFESTQRDLIAKNAEGFFKNSRVGSPATSITQLSPQSGALVAMNDRPFAPGLIYHSIIAKAGSGDLATSTDLIVSYSSSHLEGAASEKVVKGNHGCLSSNETINEIKRILSLHLRENDPITIARRKEATRDPKTIEASTHP
jgi:pimeloyl-ACP methyl ester carboxylesterase